MTIKRNLNRRSRNRVLWIVFAMPLVGLIAASISIWLQFRQDDLNHALIQAIKRRQNNLAISLLNEGASANAQDIPYKPMTVNRLVYDLWARLYRIKPPQEPRPTALMLACTVRGSSVHPMMMNAAPAELDLMHALLSHGVDLNKWDEGDNATALDTQIVMGDINVVKLLLEHAALVNPKLRTPPLRYAVRYNRVAKAKLLLEYGAAVDARAPDDGTTALYEALGASVPMLDLLVSNGANINAKDEDGRTPLMLAVVAGTEKVRFLLQHGADASIRNREGETALDLAKKARNSSDKQAIVRLLSEAEAAKGTRH